MTMHADQLVGAPVIGSDGQAVGTVEQVFRDDVDGTPSWARIRSGMGQHFVPLTGSRMTKSGLNVPFDTQKIVKEPDLKVDKHMSVGQEEELRKYFGLTVPEQTQAGQAPAGQAPAARAPAGQATAGEATAGQALVGDGEASGMAEPPQTVRTQKARTDSARTDSARTDSARTDSARTDSARTEAQAQPAQAQPAEVGSKSGQDWLIRAEERVAVTTEMIESGRVRLHKYVDVEPVEQAVHLFHEEYEIERVPITPEDRISGSIAESEQEIILHEERAIISKESVPVERVRLAARKVQEDKTVTDEIRKERIEVETLPSAPQATEMQDEADQRRSYPGQQRNP